MSSKRSPPQSKAVRPRTVALFKRDDFDDLCLLGEGFFSFVYKVQHKVTKQYFVLKLPKVLSESSLEQHEIAKASLLHETQMLQRLNHPNVLRLVGQCIGGETPNMVVEFINRGTLEVLLADKQVVLDTTTRVRLAAEIAGALAYLHANGVFHKDLSSKNILIREHNADNQGAQHNKNSVQYSAVVADLGLASCHRSMRRSASSEDVFEDRQNSAKSPAEAPTERKKADSGETPRTNAFSTSSLNSNGSVSEDEDPLGSSEYGSAWWKAPEQIVSGDEVPYTDRCDVYSLGILLAELVTRLPAVPDPGLIPRHDRIFGFALDFEKFRVHPQVPVDAPPSLVQLVGDCCRVEPTRRPSASQAESTLRRVLNELLRKSAKPDAAPSPVTTGANEPVQRKSYRPLSKPKGLSQNKPNRQHSDRLACESGWNAKRDRDFFRTLRPVIAQRFSSALESLKPRRRSASLSRVATHAPPEM